MSDAVGQATGMVLERGILGALVVLLLLAVVYLWRRLEREHAARLQDSRETTETLLETHREVTEAIRSLNLWAQELRTIHGRR
jgi:uncharacterized membrane protein